MSKEWLQGKKETLEYNEALKVATHKGIYSETLYRKSEDSLSPDFFGFSSQTWRKANFYNDILEDEKYYEKITSGNS